MQHITRYDWYSLYVELQNCDGSAMDLSDCSVEFDVRDKKAGTQLLTYTYTNPDTNKLVYQFSGSETAALNPGSAICAIKVFRANNLAQEVWTEECVIDDGVINAYAV